MTKKRKFMARALAAADIANEGQCYSLGGAVSVGNAELARGSDFCLSTMASPLDKAQATPVDGKDNQSALVKDQHSERKEVTRASEAKPACGISKKLRQNTKRKRQSPFRVKVGCVAAVRFKAERQRIKPVRNGITADQDANGSATSSTHPVSIEVWSDPIPGKDDGWALIGSRVRCLIPRRNTSKTFLEGEVISILARHVDGRGVEVSLLVDENDAKMFLSIFPRDLAVCSDQITNGKHISEGEKRRLQFERVIRGEGKVALLLTLADAVGGDGLRGRQRHLMKNNDGHDVESGSRTGGFRWAVRKRIVPPSSNFPAAPKKGIIGNGSKNDPLTRFVGDGNDDQSQQKQNWRWLVRHMESATYSGGGYKDHHLCIGEVCMVSASSDTTSSGTLATVTMRRLFLPEHTNRGKMAHHRPTELFDDENYKPKEDAVGGEFKIPIEDLVMVSRRLERVTCSSLESKLQDNMHWRSFVTHSYSPRTDCYAPTLLDGKHAAGEPLFVCHLCRRSYADSKGLRKCSSGRSDPEFVCDTCCNLSLQRSTDQYTDHIIETSLQTPQSMDNDTGLGNFYPCLRRTITCTNTFDFDLPPDFISQNDNWGVSHKTIRNVPKPFRRPRQSQATIDKGSALPKQNRDRASSEDPLSSKPRTRLPSSKTLESKKEDEDILVNSCSRVNTYDPMKKDFTFLHSAEFLSDANNRVHSSRRCDDDSTAKHAGAAAKETKKATGRAARASQRRMLKDVASFGTATFGIDALSGRDKEQSIRFGRSGIHAWGVFADEAIRAGDMIVEYRGVLIGNKVAEKREKEYEKAKIGSDYMFRIDDEIVCDATYCGNVARFINASCDPNCYTQIITINGSKRIVIYAKRNIQPGEELVYDYKFPIEYDGKKHIKCHCGAVNCRGYMNWDKRYE